jgi:hypothetical protein
MEHVGAARLWSQRPETLVMSFFQLRSVVTLVNFPHRVSSFMNITMTEIELPLLLSSVYFPSVVSPPAMLSSPVRPR